MIALELRVLEIPIIRAIEMKSDLDKTVIEKQYYKLYFESIYGAISRNPFTIIN